MTKEKIAEVKTWIKRMGINLSRAIKLAARMLPADLQESNDLFWALVKYTENVQESAKQLDEINNKIYPELIEISEDDWRGLKGMRDRLAHAFWNIDPQILWSTVTEDFPVLYALVATIGQPRKNCGKLPSETKRGITTLYSIGGGKLCWQAGLFC